MDTTKLKVIETESVHIKNNGHDIFNQLAVKVDMNGIDDQSFFEWLDYEKRNTPNVIRGAEFLEKEGVRDNPPQNVAVYYDDDELTMLPTGALIRTSCSKLTHAFCAFKMPEDKYGNRKDRRHVFEGESKATIQREPYSEKSIAIVKKLLTRTDVEHPGIFLKKEFGVEAVSLSPALILFGNRSTFYVTLDGYDVLRCSIDRSKVTDFRKDPDCKKRVEFREVEVSLYPRIPDVIKDDERVITLIEHLVNSLKTRFEREVIYDIKYQRGAKALGMM